MRVDLLGPLRIRTDEDTETTVSGARLRGLAVLLALNTGRPVSADRVAGALWTGEPPSANTVQSLVSRLRGVLGDRGLIESGPGGYRLTLAESDVDIHGFDRLAAAGREALAGGDFAAAASSLREALALWRGEPDELSAVDDQAAVRVLTLRESVRDDLAEAEIGAGNAETVLPQLRERAAAQPFRERVQAQLLLALAATGAQAEALARYETVKERLAEELGADPGPALVAAHREVLRTETAPPPAHVNNLPAPLTSFIGRDADVVAVEEALSAHRLVTATGPGGCGKTRLAVQAAHRIAAGMDVRMVELAPVTDGAEVPHAVVAALGLRDSGAATGFGAAVAGTGEPVERTIAAIGDRPTLLVFDNCEHLLDAVANLAARLLARCPRLRLLVTSREPLRLTGEVVHPVRELPYPDGEVGLDEAARFPAVRLLLERGAAASPGFRLDESNLADVVEICRRLDGLPLAIELAAARLRALNPKQLAVRLGERFRLLTGGDRAALPRQRTLRAVVDWSWDILDEPERVLLARMSVFAGGMDLETVEAVCGDELDETAYTLASLVDKSLVSLTEDRYRMLETIREYGAEKLAAMGEATRLRRRHGEFFADLAETADSRLRGSEQLDWIRRLNADHDNIVAAARRAIADGAGETAARVVAGMLWFWWVQGRHVLISDLARPILAGSALPARERVLMEVAAALELNDVTAEVTDPMARLRGIQRLKDDSGLDGDPHPFLKLLDVLFRLMTGDIPGMIRLGRELGADPDPWIRASGYAFRANVLYYNGRVDYGEKLLSRALELYRRAGDRWGIALTAASLADLAWARGDTAAARRHLELADTAESEFGIRPGDSQIRTRLTYFLLSDAEPWENLRELEAEIDAALRVNSIELAGYLHLIAAQYLRLAGDPVPARGHLAAGRDLLTPHLATIRQRHTGPPDMTALLYGVTARFGVDADAADAERSTAAAITEAAVAADTQLLAIALETDADRLLRGGDPRAAAVRLGLAAQVWGAARFVTPDGERIEAALRAALGDAEFEAGYREGRSRSRTRLLEQLAAAGD